MAIRIARREQAKLRMGVQGTSGSGKTMSSLLMAKVLGKKIGLIDSERGSASLYAGEPGIPEFGLVELENFSVDDYVKAIGEFAAEGYDVLIIDSLSHSWQAALEAVDRAGGWVKAGKNISPALQRLINTILRYPGHVICTMRSRTEYAVEKNDKGQNTLKKLGLAPQVRNDTEYEFTVVIDIDRGAKFTVLKSRCGDALPQDEVLERSDLPTHIAKVKAWLAKGAPISAKSEAIERIKFCPDLAGLKGVAAFLNEHKGEMSPEDLAETKALYLARKTALTDEASAGDL